MIKLNASYSKKVPAEQEYSSRSYHVALEVELPSGQTAGQLKQKIHDTFKLAEEAVERELSSTTQQTTQPKPQLRITNPNQPDTSTQPATNKQIQYILRLAKDSHKGLQELNETAQIQFHSENIYQLNRRDASTLLDQLKDAA